MSDKTDYKRLWRNAQDEIVKLVALLAQANNRLEVQADIIEQIRDGKITLEELAKIKEENETGEQKIG